jgi:hypothetical protein
MISLLLFFMPILLFIPFSQTESNLLINKPIAALYTEGTGESVLSANKV